MHVRTKKKVHQRNSFFSSFLFFSLYFMKDKYIKTCEIDYLSVRVKVCFGMQGAFSCTNRH